MKLTDGREGYKYIVININLEKEAKRRLEILGMTEYSTLLLLKRKPKGAMVIKVRGSRFAIGQAFAKGITVGGESK
jgi:ferrous iron transport protein A